MRLEMNVNQLSKETSELKALAVELVEENVALQLENDNLKRCWAMMNQLLLILRIQTSKSCEKPLPSKDNLAILYGEGFHICKGELFGKHRHGEDCLFCLEVLSD